jgi:hypothetical protein
VSHATFQFDAASAADQSGAREASGDSARDISGAKPASNQHVVADGSAQEARQPLMASAPTAYQEDHSATSQRERQQQSASDQRRRFARRSGQSAFAAALGLDAAAPSKS